MVAEHEHRIRSSPRRGRRASRRCAARQHAADAPGHRGVEHRERHAVERRPRTARPDAPASGRAWRRGCRARGASGRRAARSTARNASYSSAQPGVGEIALHHDRRRDRARASRRRPRRFITSGYGGHPARARRTGPIASVAGSPVRPHSVSPKCTSLAVAIVASEPPGGLRQRARHAAGSHRSGAAPSTSSGVLGVGLEAVDTRDVVRPVGRDLVVADPRRHDVAGLRR